ncbi:DNA-binding response regulator [Chryseobacterium wangxinyae]|uniref:DNA-binding response regulator n=1 Tax=Chryseobacterium sp. CY353 TaxID=2997334 RepID=UPI00226F05F1|nr:response regulator [Chryseobacterium sp. CY353]MCY0968921.1 response regulator [Chryseobacterium sp. CY353]
MLKKALIAEDFESFNSSVQKALEELKIDIIDNVQYCDDALAKIQKSIRDENHYELLITDLSFVDDHRNQNLTGGRELISAVKKEQPHMKIIVFSIEDRAEIIDDLFKSHEINGFVSKGREDLKELKRAVKAIYNNEKYISLNIKNSIKTKNSYDFTRFEITLVKLLSEGMKQKQIPDYLKEKGIKPSSLSSVEKALNTMKEALEVSNNEQLIALCKDWGII